MTLSILSTGQQRVTGNSPTEHCSTRTPIYSLGQTAHNYKIPFSSGVTFLYFLQGNCSLRCSSSTPALPRLSSNGILPVTKMYRMTPMAHVSAFLGSYGSPSRISGAAYDLDPQYVLQPCRQYNANILMFVWEASLRVYVELSYNFAETLEYS